MTTSPIFLRDGTYWAIRLYNGGLSNLAIPQIWWHAQSSSNSTYCALPNFDARCQKLLSGSMRDLDQGWDVIAPLLPVIEKARVLAALGDPPLIGGEGSLTYHEFAGRWMRASIRCWIVDGVPCPPWVRELSPTADDSSDCCGDPATNGQQYYPRLVQQLSTISPPLAASVFQRELKREHVIVMSACGFDVEPIGLSSDQSKPTRRSQNETDQSVADFLYHEKKRGRDFAKDKPSIREIVAATNCALPSIQKTPAWNQLQVMYGSTGRAPRAVSLTDKVSDTVGRDDHELNALIDDQRKDYEPSPVDDRDPPNPSEFKQL